MGGVKPRGGCVKLLRGLLDAYSLITDVVVDRSVKLVLVAEPLADRAEGVVHDAEAACSNGRLEECALGAAAAAKMMFMLSSELGRARREYGRAAVDALGLLEARLGVGGGTGVDEALSRMLSGCDGRVKRLIAEVAGDMMWVLERLAMVADPDQAGRIARLRWLVGRVADAASRED